MNDGKCSQCEYNGTNCILRYIKDIVDYGPQRNVGGWYTEGYIRLKAPC